MIHLLSLNKYSLVTSF